MFSTLQTILLLVICVNKETTHAFVVHKRYFFFCNWTILEFVLSSSLFVIIFLLLHQIDIFLIILN